MYFLPAYVYAERKDDHCFLGKEYYWFYFIYYKSQLINLSDKNSICRWVVVATISSVFVKSQKVSLKSFPGASSIQYISTIKVIFMHNYIFLYSPYVSTKIDKITKITIISWAFGHTPLRIFYFYHFANFSAALKPKMCHFNPKITLPFCRLLLQYEPCYQIKYHETCITNNFELYTVRWSVT